METATDDAARRERTPGEQRRVASVYLRATENGSVRVMRDGENREACRESGLDPMYLWDLLDGCAECEELTLVMSSPAADGSIDSLTFTRSSGNPDRPPRDGMQTHLRAIDGDRVYVIGEASSSPGCGELGLDPECICDLLDRYEGCEELTLVMSSQHGSESESLAFSRSSGRR